MIYLYLNQVLKNEFMQKGKKIIDRFDDMKNIASTRLEEWLEEDEDINQNLDFKQNSFYNKDINEKTAYISIIAGLLAGFLLFPSPDFTKSILVGLLIPLESFIPFVSQSLLFLSFLFNNKLFNSLLKFLSLLFNIFIII